MHYLLLKIISLLHLLFLIFTITSPFANSNYFMLLHSIFIPFLILHWITNDDKCVLTIAEKQIGKKIHGDKYEINECFTCKVIEPVYNFKKNNGSHTRLIYASTLILWFISIYRLINKYRSGEIKNWRYLFKF